MDGCLIKSILSQHWLTLPLFLITTFGFGYQAVPFFSWLYIPIILLYTRNKSVGRIVIAYFISSTGFCFGYLGNFRISNQDPRFPAAWVIALASLGVHVLLAVTLLAERYLLSQQHHTAARVLLFPSLWTGLWFLFSRFGIIGDYPTLSTALINWPDFAQVASLGGRPLIDFLVSLFGTCILELGSFPVQLIGSSPIESLQRDEEADENDVPLTKRQYAAMATHPITLFSIVMALVLSYGGARTNIRQGSFYQVGYSDYIPKNEQVGCVVGPGTDYPELQMDHDVWFNKSSMLAEAGAKLIIWSETTTVVNTTEDEKVFLERAIEFALTRKVYLGVTYATVDPVAQNKLVFITKQGKIGINYNKANPVPGVETQPAGPSVLQYVDTEEFGRVSGGICFDYNFPHFIGQASTLKVDLMLQPSWTWGPIGTHHQQGNVFRAVENGFTLFRCVSQGVSGVFEPTLNGIFNQKVASLNVEQYLFYLPLQKRITTLYGCIGDSFSYLCLIGSVTLLAFVYRHRRKQSQIMLFADI